MANTVSERIVTGRKYRIFTGVIGRLWDRISFWTKASDVEIDVKDEQGTVTGTQSLQEFADDIGNMVQDMTGATSTTDGEHGLVPAPEAGDERKVLSGAGTWIDHDAGYEFDTIEEMEEALPNIPEDSTIFVGEESPTAITGDPALSDTSENWVKNKVVSRTIGKLSQLKTTFTTNLVGAINELRDKFDENYLLPLTAGGTGANTATTARTNLGLGTVATENTVPLTKGGTGGITSLAARQNLETVENSNIAVREETRTMSAQRVAGSYVYVKADDKLYLITSTIASGGTLTPGTNATVKNIGDVLSTLTSDLASKTTDFNALNINDYTASGTRDIFTSILEGVIKPNINKIDVRNLNVSFYVSSNSSKPNDLPANTLTWNYAYGKLIWRTMNASYVGDGCIILFGFGSGMAIKYFTNNNLGNWNYVTMTT